MNPKPCPVCGGEAVIYRSVEDWVECSQCGFMPTARNQHDKRFSDGFHNTAEHAIGLWNEAVKP